MVVYEIRLFFKNILIIKKKSEFIKLKFIKKWFKTQLKYYD